MFKNWCLKNDMNGWHLVLAALLFASLTCITTSSKDIEAVTYIFFATLIASIVACVLAITHMNIVYGEAHTNLDKVKALNHQFHNTIDRVISPIPYTSDVHAKVMRMIHYHMNRTEQFLNSKEYFHPEKYTQYEKEILLKLEVFERQFVGHK